MYNNIKYLGKTLPEWQKELRYQFTLGELYQMALRGEDLSSYAVRQP